MIIGLCAILALEALAPDLDLADLSHLPGLLSQYQKHRSECADRTFGGLHYNNGNHITANPTDHQDLPFSKRQHHRVSFQIAQEPSLFSPHTTYIVLTKIERMIDPSLHTNCVTSQVWQPPRASFFL